MGTSQRSASLQRPKQSSRSNESETLEQAFSRAKQDMMLLVQDELVLKKDIQDVQSLFSKIMSQLDELDTNRRNNYTSESSSTESAMTYAKTNLNRNHQVCAAALGLGLPQLKLEKYRITQSENRQFQDSESTSTSYYTESSLYPSDCAPHGSEESDFSQASSISSRSSRRKGKHSKRVMNKTYIIEPTQNRRKMPEPSILDKSTFFENSELNSYNGFMPVLSSTFAGNMTNQTNIEPCAADMDTSSCTSPPLTSAVTLKRHLRNKGNNANQVDETSYQSLQMKSILKNSSYFPLQATESDTTTTTDSPRNDTDSNDISMATDGNTTLGTRPSPLGAYSYELTQNSTIFRRRMKVRFEDISCSCSDSCDSCSSQTNHIDSCDQCHENQRTKRFSKKPPTPKKCTPNKTVDTSSDSDNEQSMRKMKTRKTIHRQVSFADSVRDQSVPDGCVTPDGSPICDGDTSLWLENSQEVFVDYETERQARLAMNTTQMVEFDDSSDISCVSDDNLDVPMVKLPWLPLLAFDITEDSFKATLEELEKVENHPVGVYPDHNMTYNDNFALISHIEKEFMKCREGGNGQETYVDQINVLEQIEKQYNCISSEKDTDTETVDLNVSLNDSFPKHQKCVDHDVHIALGEPCSFYLEDTLTLLENSKLFELHMDQLSESGFESTHNSSVDSSQTDSSSIESAIHKLLQVKVQTDNVKPVVITLSVPPSLEVTRNSTPDITSVQTPNETIVFDDNVHTMCEMNFQGAPQRDYCDSASSSAYSSSSGMGSHNSSQLSSNALPMYNTPVTSVEPTPDTSAQADSCNLIAPYASPASICMSLIENMTNVSRTSASGSSSTSDMVTILNPPQLQTLFNLGLSPISSKDSVVMPQSNAVPMNSPCGCDDENDAISAPHTSPVTLRKQLFPSVAQSPVTPCKETKHRGQGLVRSQLFKIVQRSNSKLRGKKSGSESDEKSSGSSKESVAKSTNDHQAVYKKKRDLKKKLKIFSSLFHRKDKEAMNQIKTLAHI